MEAIILGREICRDLSCALEREWLVSNGIGGYASSTICGANTRRYHGLLVAALHPPLERTVLLSKIDEEVSVGDQTYYLGTNEYPNDTVHPGGFVHLWETRLDLGLPTFTFNAGNAILRKTVWMEKDRNTTYVHYQLDPSSPRAIALALVPLANYRDYHGETRGSLEWNFGVTRLDHGCEVTAFPGAAPYRLLCIPDAQFTVTGVWYWHFVYRWERERGLNFMEDLYMPGLFRSTLEPGQSLTVVATTEDLATVELDGEMALARRRAYQAGLLRDVRRGFGEAEVDDLAAHLALAADQFIVRRPASGQAAPAAPPPASPPDHAAGEDRPARAVGSATVIAGYHWFADWGRDAMIGLPGLTLLTGRPAEARSILRTFARYVDKGMIPNRFPDRGETPEYNTVDATLWYFQALHHYLSCTGDWSLLEELYPVLTEVVEWHLRGTRYGIGVRDDGLLFAGERGVQLTWMDAKVGDWVVTPRVGKPVEVNALWYNTSCLMAGWSERLGESPKRYREISPLTAESFAKRFWYDRGGYLFDVVDGPDGDDASFRPNQVLALSLPHPLVKGEKAVAIMEAVTARLLTPYGLRSLAADDPQYVGRYRGDQWARDGAYHRGTVWTWLIGPFVDAHLRVYQDPEITRSYLDSYADHLREAGIGSINEIFEGDEPHRPCGCIAQAWSVAEVLRAWRALAPSSSEAGRTVLER